jgi:hypothetical protein
MVGLCGLAVNFLQKDALVKREEWPVCLACQLAKKKVARDLLGLR